MYGQIHCVIRELVQKKFGNETWETVLKKSGLDEHHSFLMFNRYDDASTFKLVGAVSETLDISVETVLEVFGEFFFDYCIRHGYDKMLQTLGSDIKSFIQNLDSLHALLALSYKGISAPSFRCEDGPDGSLILHYYSSRPGLYPIVKGVLKAVARDLFDQSLEMSVIEQNKEDIGCDRYQEHTAFRVMVQSTTNDDSDQVDSINDEKDQFHDLGGNSSSDRVELRSHSNASETTPLTPTEEEKRVVSFNPATVLLRASDFCSAFPYHVIFDRNLKIKQCGVLIQKHSCHVIREGTPLNLAFEIMHPKMVISIENIRKFINAVFLLAICCQEEKKRMIVKGQMIWIEDTEHMIFIGSPRLTSLNELVEMNVYLADIPLYDVTRELVLLNQQRIAEIDIAKRLDETTAQLKKTGQALEEEKRKTETLLHQMLPRKVANALTQGRKVEAEKFDQVTILFSDIVTFTNIASACSPMDIVDMLNEMYRRFDQRTSQHNVYKVETIGDAYMIVSGVPEKTSFHAPPVANFAMDMVEDAGHVMSPATGKPLQIRVGVHTGPVVAGVVGVKMPRYCLFGDTVNTASRMESHGSPGRIHLSATTRRALQGWGYAFKVRGEMEVKGKGIMCTSFLCGNTGRRLAEPDDEFTSLDIFQDSTENRAMGHLKTDSSEFIDDKGTDEEVVNQDKDISKQQSDPIDSQLNASSELIPTSTKITDNLSDTSHINSHENLRSTGLEDTNNSHSLSKENVHLDPNSSSNNTDNVEKVFFNVCCGCSMAMLSPKTQPPTELPTKKATVSSIIPSNTGPAPVQHHTTDHPNHQPQNTNHQQDSHHQNKPHNKLLSDSNKHVEKDHNNLNHKSSSLSLQSYVSSPEAHPNHVHRCNPANSITVEELNASNGNIIESLLNNDKTHERPSGASSNPCLTKYETNLPVESDSSTNLRVSWSHDQLLKIRKPKKKCDKKDRSKLCSIS